MARWIHIQAKCPSSNPTQLGLRTEIEKSLWWYFYQTKINLLLFFFTLTLKPVWPRPGALLSRAGSRSWGRPVSGAAGRGNRCCPRWCLPPPPVGCRSCRPQTWLMEGIQKKCMENMKWHSDKNARNFDRIVASCKKSQSQWMRKRIIQLV